MQKGMDHEEAIAYGIFVLFAFLILGGIILILLVPGFNGVLVGTNTFIDKGMVGERTASAISWNTTIFGFVGGITLIGAFLWAIVRANQERLGGG